VRYFLFGAGDLILHAAEWLKRNKRQTILICADRHLREPFGAHGSFANHLDAQGIEYRLSTDPNTDDDLRSLIAPGCCGMSIGAAWIFKQPFIDLFDLGLYNLHYARLPHDRGGGGFSWKIMRGERRGGCAIHRISSKADAGPIVKYCEFTYPAATRITAEMAAFNAIRAKAMIEDFLDELAGGSAPQANAQPDHFSMYWPRLDTDLHGFVDWTWKAAEIERFICAFDDPYKGCSSFVGDRRVRLKQAFTFVSDGGFHPFQAGVIYRKTASEVFIACHDAALIVHSVQDDAGENMLPSLRVGDRFHTPAEHLEKAKAARVYYHPGGKSLTRQSLA
jgi:methionyl-tRNA formyltransferase